MIHIGFPTVRVDIAVSVDSHHAAALGESTDGARRRSPRADSIHLCRRPLLERLVRTHMIERRHPVIASALLCDQILRGVVLEVKAHVDVHALVRSIVGWAPWPASHDTDPERHPPS